MEYSLKGVEINLSKEDLLNINSHETDAYGFFGQYNLIDISNDFCFDSFNRLEGQIFQYECFYSHGLPLKSELENMFDMLPLIKEQFEQDVITAFTNEEIGENENMTDYEFHSYANPNLK